MKKNGIFISYSHHDQSWLEALRVHLDYLEKEYQLSIWDDTRISPGSNWMEEIEQAIASSKVALLLVSAHFLNSEFIQREELPRFLSAAEKEGTLIFPLILNHCLFEESTSISKFQAFNAPDQPIIELNEAEQAKLFLQVAREMKKALLIEKDDSIPVILEQKNQNKVFENTLKLSLARVSLLWILQQEENREKGLTVTELFQQLGLKNRKNIAFALYEMEQHEIIEKNKLELVYWKLSSGGLELAEKFGASSLFQ